MTFGKSVVREGRQLVVNNFRRGFIHTICAHTFVKAGLEAFHALGASLRSHCLAELVSFIWGEVGNVDCHLHELLLEERNAEGLLEGLL